MEWTNYSALNERLAIATLPNGLRLFVVPKPGFHETFALLATNYGSIDRRYRNKAGEVVEDPAGIAHFLEHKLFEKDDHDAFELFGATGASANAFTSADKTAYLFSTSTKVLENLTTLLDFVQAPFFSEKTVEKEQGIIGQEIQMYQDNPGWLLYYGILSNLYPGSPLAQDVTGSIDSIAQITPEALYTAYETFYQPHNMTLTVVGDVDAEEIYAHVLANQAEKNFAAPTEIERASIFDDETDSILPYKAINAAVVRPKSAVGIKGLRALEDDASGMKQQVATRLLFELLFGDSSPLYQEWYDKGIIDDSFDYDFVSGRGYNFVTLAGDTENPSELSDALTGVIKDGVNQAAFDAERFERLKRSGIGKYYQSFNSVERIASSLSGLSFGGVNTFELGKIMQEVTLDDVVESAAALFRLDALTVVHVLPEPAVEE